MHAPVCSPSGCSARTFSSGSRPSAQSLQAKSIARAHSRGLCCPPPLTHSAPARLPLHTLPVSNHHPCCSPISPMAAIAQKSAVAGRVQGLSLK
jgi:hypothetical protein